MYKPEDEEVVQAEEAQAAAENDISEPDLPIETPPVEAEESVDEEKE